jgi:prophage regulatory protein
MTFADDTNRNEPRRMISEKQILDLLPIARSTLQNWEKERKFPRSVKIGDNRKAWFEDEVIAWQKRKQENV